MECLLATTFFLSVIWYVGRFRLNLTGRPRAAEYFSVEKVIGSLMKQGDL
jgi:hypothetical protein